jgi:hypothetical protein
MMRKLLRPQKNKKRHIINVPLANPEHLPGFVASD